MSSNLFPKDGVFNPLRRFAFTNITDDLFTFHWDGKPISVKAHEAVELPQHLMVVATTKLVDKIMIAKFKQDEEAGINVQKDGRHKAGLSLGVPAAREVYENQIVRELEVDEESPQIQVMRTQIRDQVLHDIDVGTKKAAPVESVVASVNLENMVNVQEGGKAEEFAGAKKSKKK